MTRWTPPTPEQIKADEELYAIQKQIWAEKDDEPLRTGRAAKYPQTENIYRRKRGV